jgi:exosome complex exonuclease RRP6
MMNKSTPSAPKPLEETPLIFIVTPEELDAMITELREQKEIAVDVEHHSYRTFLGLTCLIQISTREKDYVIDTLALWRELEALNEIFTNPKVLKVLHGSSSDLEWLQRDFGVYVVGLFDTFLAMKQLNFEQFSLQHLLAHFCSVDLDKKYQLADWRLRSVMKNWN